MRMAQPRTWSGPNLLGDLSRIDGCQAPRCYIGSCRSTAKALRGRRLRPMRSSFHYTSGFKLNTSNVLQTQSADYEGITSQSTLPTFGDQDDMESTKWDPASSTDESPRSIRTRDGPSSTFLSGSVAWTPARARRARTTRAAIAMRGAAMRLAAVASTAARMPSRTSNSPRSGDMNGCVRTRGSGAGHQIAPVHGGCR